MVARVRAVQKSELKNWFPFSEDEFELNWLHTTGELEIGLE